MNLSTSSKLGQLGVPHPSWPLFLGLTGLTNDHPGIPWVYLKYGRPLTIYPASPTARHSAPNCSSTSGPKIRRSQPTPRMSSPSVPATCLNLCNSPDARSTGLTGTKKTSLVQNLRHVAWGRSLPWMDGWMGGWMDGWIDGWMDGWEHCQRICFLKELGGKEEKKTAFLPCVFPKSCSFSQFWDFWKIGVPMVSHVSHMKFPTIKHHPPSTTMTNHEPASIISRQPSSMISNINHEQPWATISNH